MSYIRILSQRNREKLVFEGCTFAFETFSGDKSKKFWRCDRRDDGCKVRLHTDDTTYQVVKKLNEHNHDECAQLVEGAAATRAIKKRARKRAMEQPAQAKRSSFERRLEDRVNNQVSFHRSVDHDQIKVKEIELAEELNTDDVSSSASWCKRFVRPCGQDGHLENLAPARPVDRLLFRVRRSSRKQPSGNHTTKNCTISKESTPAQAKSQKTKASPKVKRDFGSFHSSNLKEQIKNAESPSYVPPTLPVKPPNFEEYSTKSIEFGHAAKVKHFFLEKECTFLNHGAFGAVLKEVLDYSHEWQKYVERQPLRFFDRMLFPQIIHVQKRLADFVGCDTSDIVMVSNVTTATNAVLQSLELDQHSVIYYLNITYGAVKRTIKYVCEKTGAKMREEKLLFPIKDGNDILDLVDRTLKEGTTLAVFDHISSNYAFIMPVKELVLLCHTKGVPVMIDGAHALGALELNLCYLGADYYTANAHKWFCASKGCAFLYVKQEKQHTVHGLAISHGHDAGFHSQFSWTGAKDYCAFLSLHAVLNFWNAIGPKVIRDHCNQLLVEAIQLFQEKWNTEMLAPIDMHGMMCCLTLPSAFNTDKPDLSYSDAEEIQNCLYHEYNIEAPIKCIEEKLCVRICAHAYNEMDDYEKLADAILEIEKSMFS